MAIVQDAVDRLWYESTSFIEGDGTMGTLLKYNASCYQRKLMLEARANKAALGSKPLAVTAWIDFGSM
jgi:hypothetical protein